MQTRMSRNVVREDVLGQVRKVAGVDVAYAKAGRRVVCAAAALDAETLQVIDIAIEEGVVDVPYAPGFFSLRELPFARRALRKLKSVPDLVLCDGHGIAHPRRFGLASHLGVLDDIATIGCAKTRLHGTHEEPAPERGSHARLLDSTEVIGAALRTQSNVKPIYVSIGHRVSLETSCMWALRLSPRFRIPEPLRVADHAARMAMQS